MSVGDWTFVEWELVVLAVDEEVRCDGVPGGRVDRSVEHTGVQVVLERGPGEHAQEEAQDKCDPSDWIRCCLDADRVSKESLESWVV